MPEKPEMEYIKLEGKGWLYKNEKKSSPTHPDYKGKLAGVKLSELEKLADADGIVNIHLSGWSEEDKSGVSRVGMRPSGAIPKQETVSADADPFQ